MIHAREDYSRIQDPEGKIPEDEPVFLIRGQDPLAPEAVRDYARRALYHGAKLDLVEACEGQAVAMEQYQVDHPESVHTPDL